MTSPGGSIAATRAEWQEGRYSSHFLNLGCLSLSVDWGMTKLPDGTNGYVWSASNGTRSPRSRRYTLEEAKSKAEAWARDVLTRALSSLSAEVER